MKALFVNTTIAECGVYQYGVNLFSSISQSSQVEWRYADCPDYGHLCRHVAEFRPEVVVYNWQAGQGGFMAGAPFRDLSASSHVLVYHDCEVVDSHWDAILFSDPTMAQHGNWFPIGRPIPQFPREPLPDSLIGKVENPVIGVHGFRGAWADRVVARVMKEFKEATVRLSLPFSHYCDAGGAEATSMAERCRAMADGTGIEISVSHSFMDQHQLIHWLRKNWINCYFRDPAWVWRGVSSAPDAALAAKRPVAVNHCNAFRHLHGASPSICYENDPIGIAGIILNGIKPLEPLYESWSPENIAKQVDSVLLAL